MSNLGKTFLPIFQDRFRLTNPPESPPALPENYTHANEYILSSLLQKAIRRGDLNTARRAGHQLAAMNPSRLWRRLRVTALEDIGVGDSDAAAEIVAISVYPELRRALGGSRAALDHVLIQGCMAVKDRTPDHLYSIVEREPGKREQAEILRHASDNALIAVLADRARDITQRAHAAATLHRQCEDLARQIRHARLAPAFDMFENLGAPELLVAACRAYAAREADILPLYALLAWSLHQAEGVPAIGRQHELPPVEMIAGIPAYGFDPHHTRVGKRAVQLWRRSYLTPLPWSARQAGMALWNIEAAACDQILDWPLGQEIRRRAYRADLLDYGLPETRHDALYLWVIRESEALTSARRAAWRSAKAL